MLLSTYGAAWRKHYDILFHHQNTIGRPHVGRQHIRIDGFYFVGCDHIPAARNRWTLNAQHPVLQEAAKQLKEYFAEREKVSRSRYTWSAPISRKRSGGKSRSYRSEKPSATVNWRNGWARPKPSAPQGQTRAEIPSGSSFPAIGWWVKTGALAGRWWLSWKEKKSVFA